MKKIRKQINILRNVKKFKYKEGKLRKRERKNKELKMNKYN